MDDLPAAPLTPDPDKRTIRRYTAQQKRVVIDTARARPDASLGDLSRHFGIPVSTLYQWVRHLPNRTRHRAHQYPAWRRREVVAWYEADEQRTIAAASRTFDIPTATVAMWVKHVGRAIGKRRNPNVRTSMQAAVEDVRDGMKIKHAAKLHDVSVAGLAKKCRKLGVEPGVTTMRKDVARVRDEHAVLKHLVAQLVRGTTREERDEAHTKLSTMLPTLGPSYPPTTQRRPRPPKAALVTQCPEIPFTEHVPRTSTRAR